MPTAQTIFGFSLILATSLFSSTAVAQDSDTISMDFLMCLDGQNFYPDCPDSTDDGGDITEHSGGLPECEQELQGVYDDRNEGYDAVLALVARLDEVNAELAEVTAALKVATCKTVEPDAEFEEVAEER
jgi:hypothetical protein